MRPRLVISRRKSKSVRDPAATPMIEMRPPVPIAARSPGRFGAPTSSRMTSNGRWSTKDSGSTGSAPSAATSANRAGSRTVRDDVAADCDAQLNGGDADTARAAVDAEAFTRCQPTLSEERVVRRCERLGKACGLGPAQLIRDMHGAPLVRHRHLGVGASGDERHHPVSRHEVLNLRADRGDLAETSSPGTSDDVTCLAG